ncbi:MAG: gliding motility-associated C-terminal domain-containing protein [Crocinitomicaceae bacterium]|nr:gliding motility-associated C-terminal domain-containing protein [Crocinitomicaceae bacterium]
MTIIKSYASWTPVSKILATFKYSERLTFRFPTMLKAIVLLLFFNVSVQAQDDSITDSCEVLIPKVVTIDCQFGNDYMFRMEHTCLIKTFHIIIFNRWGDILFESEDPDEYFDATEQPQGTYTWEIEFQYYSGSGWETQGFFHKLD